MPQQKIGSARQTAAEVEGLVRDFGKKKLIVAGYGEFSEVNNFCAECGVFHSQESMGKEEIY